MIIALESAKFIKGPQIDGYIVTGYLLDSRQ